MVHPDEICYIHGEPYKYCRKKTGPRAGEYVKWCTSCRRIQRGQRSNDAPTCRHGHIKTPLTWRHYRSGARCVICEKQRKHRSGLRKAA